MTPHERDRIVAARAGWFVRKLSPSFEKSLDARITDDLTAGIVELVEVEIARLGQADPYGDEGPLLFCETTDGWVFGLIGQWQYDKDIVDLDQNAIGDADICRRFRLVRAPQSGLPLQLQPIGPIEPMVPSVTIELGKIKYLPETFVVQASLDSLASRLRHLGEYSRPTDGRP
jgi:hypothetical protein